MRKPTDAEQGASGEQTASLEARVAALCGRSVVMNTVIDEALCAKPHNDNARKVEDTPEAKKRDWYSRRALFVTGPHASGKSVMVRAAFKDEEGFAIFDTGPILRNYHSEDRPQLSFGAWAAENETIYGETFTDELLAHHMQATVDSGTVEHPSGLIVIGNRSHRGASYLANRLNPSDSRIVYVDAPTDTLYERYKAREGKHDITPGDFDSILEADARLGIHELAQRADHHIRNDDELSFVAQQLRDYVSAWIPSLA